MRQIGDALRSKLDALGKLVALEMGEFEHPTHTNVIIITIQKRKVLKEGYPENRTKMDP